jgi:uncharacterized protein YfkK (UPF0435 family)
LEEKLKDIYHVVSKGEEIEVKEMVWVVENEV